MLERMYQVPEEYVTAPDWLRPVILCACIINIIGGYARGGHFYALLGLVLAAFGMYNLWKIVMKNRLTQKLIEYGNRFENVYVSSQFPDDRNVVWRAERERELLEVSGNKLGVQVLTICFREGARVNETWEEFEALRDTTIAADRAARHEEIKTKYPEFYYKHVLKMKPYSSPIKAKA